MQTLRKINVLYADGWTPSARTLLFLVCSMLFSHSVLSQQNAPSASVVYSSQSAISISLNISNFHFENLSDSSFRLKVEGLDDYPISAGQPLIPFFSSLIEVSAKSSLNVSVDSSSISTLFWSSDTLHHLSVVPQPVLKNGHTQLAPMTSLSNDFNNPFDITFLGIKRDKKVFLIRINPISFLNGNDSILIYKSLRLSLSSSDGSSIRIVNTNLVAPQPKSYSNNSLSHQVPDRYVVVAPSIYRSSLQPFLRWKRQEGYHVIEHYVDSLSANAIRDTLKQHFLRATWLNPTPLYVLLVGDVDQIPAFPGRQHIEGLYSHVTDLYYGEYTDDYLPESLVGRLAVRDTIELMKVLYKTISYEQFSLPDTQYLNRVLLVAGKELRSPAPIVTNGQVNYLKQNIYNLRTDIDTFCYYNQTSDLQSDDIYSKIRNGVGLISYSAHCTYNGWSAPTLSLAQIDSLPTDNHYFISINNCCQINGLSTDCMGKHMLRKELSGAVGVIGATNETLWEEDYFWNLGYRSRLDISPSYDDMHKGAFDRFLNLYNYPFQDRAITQSMLLEAGNWAVTESGSPYANFYWEIYNLLGDPSLMPFVGAPRNQFLMVDSVFEGDRSITLHGVPFAHVAASWSDSLLGVCRLNDRGEGSLRCSSPFFISTADSSFSDSILLVATSQFFAPLKIYSPVYLNSGEKVVVSFSGVHHVDDDHSSFLIPGDTALLSFRITNVGNRVSRPFVCHSLQSSDQFQLSPVLFFDSLWSIHSLAPRSDTTIYLQLLPLQQSSYPLVDFTLLAQVQDSSSLLDTLFHESFVFDKITPRLEFEKIWITENQHNVHSLSANRHYTLSAVIRNPSLCNIPNTRLSLWISADSSIILRDSLLLSHLAPFETDTVSLPICLSSTPADSLSLNLLLLFHSDSLFFQCTYPFSSVGIRDVPLSSSSKLYPNPAKSFVIISPSDSFHDNVCVSFFNPQGVKAFQSTIPAHSSTLIPLPSLPDDLYFVLLNDSSNYEIIRMIHLN